MSKQKLILFVEDNPAIQKTFGEILTQEGYQVIPAVDGEIGLSLAKKEKPDLILLDLILPKKDGFEVLKELKAEEQTKEIPVIVLTNLEQSTDVERALEYGATTYLVKANYSIDELLQKVRSAASS